MSNVFFYHSEVSGVSASNLAGAFSEDMMVKINDLQCDDVTNVLIRVLSLQDLADFHEAAMAGAGANTSSEPMPQHDALNFTLRVNTRAVKPGSKRISGIPESAQAGGFITVGSYITQMNALRTALYTPVVGTSTPTLIYDPVVIKRIKEVETIDGKEVITYRLPGIGDEVVYGTVTTALINTRISHQTSRGNGR